MTVVIPGAHGTGRRTTLFYVPAKTFHRQIFTVYVGRWLTVRPLTKDGKWQHKTEKEYLCVRAGEERGFTAAEFKLAQSEGWEKQYQYKAGKKKVYMTP